MDEAMTPQELNTEIRNAVKRINKLNDIGEIKTLRRSAEMLAAHLQTRQKAIEEKRYYSEIKMTIETLKTSLVQYFQDLNALGMTTDKSGAVFDAMDSLFQIRPLGTIEEELNREAAKYAQNIDPTEAPKNN